MDSIGNTCFFSHLSFLSCRSVFAQSGILLFFSTSLLYLSVQWLYNWDCYIIFTELYHPCNWMRPCIDNAEAFKFG